MSNFLALLFLFLLSQVGHWASGQGQGQWTSSYCSYSLCSGLPHIGCNNPGDYGNQCTQDSRLLDLAPYTASIVHRHNQFRNAVAGGYAPGYDPAIHMATMVWDDELAYLATLNSLTCTTQHDDCRNTDRFRQSGQNIAWRSDPPGSVLPASDVLIWAIDYWFDEYKNGDMNQINRYYIGPDSSHFTVMVAERNVAVGCSALQHSEANGNIKTIAVCNYATTNILDAPIYRSGPTASRCRQGTNPNYTNLCAENESYNVNSNSWGSAN